MVKFSRGTFWNVESKKILYLFNKESAVYPAIAKGNVVMRTAEAICPSAIPSCSAGGCIKSW